MVPDFSHTHLGSIAPDVFRLGLSATYRPGKRTVFRALDEGINYFFLFGIDTHMTRTLREVLPREREKYVVATGAYNLIWGHQNLRRTLEKRLRQLRTDYIDVFHYLGVRRADEFDDRVRAELAELRQDPRVKGISISTHDRRLAGRLAADGTLDAMMIRYNAAHRGAEQEIFPYLAAHDPGVISFTATRWRCLTRRPRGWPRDGRIPTAGMCYRFVLSNPNVDVCLCAPTNLNQFADDIAEVRKGPLAEDDLAFMRDFGDAVYRQYKYFM